MIDDASPRGCHCSSCSWKKVTLSIRRKSVSSLWRLARFTRHLYKELYAWIFVLFFFVEGNEEVESELGNWNCYNLHGKISVWKFTRSFERNRFMTIRNTRCQICVFCKSSNWNGSFLLKATAYPSGERAVERSAKQIIMEMWIGGTMIVAAIMGTRTRESVSYLRWNKLEQRVEIKKKKK